MNEVRIKETGERTLVVEFHGSVSAANAEEVGKELNAFRNENKQEQLVLDFEDLEFISSAGLRILLNMAKKEEKKIQVFNINPVIYEVFDDTGFTSIFEAHKAMKKYTSEGFELIGQGANGAVYRVDKENVIKVFQKTAPLEDIERERNLARQALLEGIPTAISYTVVKVDDCYGIMFELIEAVPLSIELKSDPDNYDINTGLYIDLYKKIHNTEGDANQFPSIKDLYHRCIDECKDYYSNEELDKLRALVDSVPDRNTLIHGDYHPNNIMYQNGELILIDMGDMSIGHPIFDFLATAATQVNLVKLSPEYAEGHTKMPAEMITKTWRRLFDSYFSEYSQEERDRIEEQVNYFSKLKVALAPVFGRGASKEIIQASVDDAKANLLPRIDELIGAVDW
jgi:uncharacterized protein (TIGR02172 family)